MSNQMLASNLLEDLSLDQQQSLAGGQTFDEGDDEGGNTRLGTGETRRYRIRSVSIVSVRKLS
ncbi:hypothetical protein [Nostoc parmelioides]|uniref:Uncharacterized protein n=1 Tax=Nostoc parmelioides FACHB-3921 TaxID=2692909 RepID=A0ABR8B9G8_9NOSO|nr:hypothetical protein [Nostoc parmelioides]MBD2250410.1 hypothetical protein [Nostoc parmelioides FACHB-3921]